MILYITITFFVTIEATSTPIFTLEPGIPVIHPSLTSRHSKLQMAEKIGSVSKKCYFCDKIIVHNWKIKSDL